MAGFELNVNKCEPCPKGQYNPDVDSQCTSCPDDKDTLDVGSTSVENCTSKLIYIFDNSDILYLSQWFIVQWKHKSTQTFCQKAFPMLANWLTPNFGVLNTWISLGN